MPRKIKETEFDKKINSGEDELIFISPKLKDLYEKSETGPYISSIVALNRKFAQDVRGLSDKVIGNIAVKIIIKEKEGH